MMADNDNEGAGLLATLNANLHSQLDLCNRLESLADSLPNTVDPQELLTVARLVGPLVKRAHEFEEGRVFPYLRAKAASDPALDESLNRLQFEHWEDETFADEIGEELMTAAFALDQIRSEKLAYMLRGFFEGLRRHIAFEREHIAPLLSDVSHA